MVSLNNPLLARPESRPDRVADYTRIFHELERLPGSGPLDKTDQLLVINLVNLMTRPQVGRLCATIRLESTFRPSMRELSEMVARIRHGDEAGKTGADAQAHRVVRPPAQVPALEAGPPVERPYRASTYRPDYANLPRDPREWRPEMFADGYEHFCAVSAAMRDRRVPNAGPLMDDE